MAESAISNASQGEKASPTALKPGQTRNGARSEGAAQHDAHAATVPPPTIPILFRTLFTAISSSMASKSALSALYFLT